MMIIQRMQLMVCPVYGAPSLSNLHALVCTWCVGGISPFPLTNEAILTTFILRKPCHDAMPPCVHDHLVCMTGCALD
jgi:hypothetical protein